MHIDRDPENDEVMKFKKTAPKAVERWPFFYKLKSHEQGYYVSETKSAFAAAM